MRKKAIIIAVILALVSAMTLANVAFAAQSNKPANSPPGKATDQTCDGESIELSKEEKLTLDLHNKIRQENELRELCVDATLTNVAREHSEDMIERGYFGHNSSDGKSSAKRLKDSGYNWSAMAENVGWGSGSYSTPASRFKAWMESEGHRVNILNEKYEEVGIGIASGELKKGGQEETVYTVEFGSKKK